MLSGISSKGRIVSRSFKTLDLAKSRQKQTLGVYLRSGFSFSFFHTVFNSFGKRFLYCIHTKKLSCLKSGVEFDMNDILYEFKNLHQF